MANILLVTVSTFYVIRPIYIFIVLYTDLSSSKSVRLNGAIVSQ